MVVTADDGDATATLSGDLAIGSGGLDINGGSVAAAAKGTVAEARLPASALGSVWESKSASFVAEARKN